MYWLQCAVLATFFVALFIFDILMIGVLADATFGA
jgi:hypothetical protein